jgi:hypothetical protein
MSAVMVGSASQVTSPWRSNPINDAAIQPHQRHGHPVAVSDHPAPGDRP